MPGPLNLETRSNRQSANPIGYVCAPPTIAGIAMPCNAQQHMMLWCDWTDPVSVIFPKIFGIDYLYLWHNWHVKIRPCVAASGLLLYFVTWLDRWRLSAWHLVYELHGKFRACAFANLLLENVINKICQSYCRFVRLLPILFDVHLFFTWCLLQSIIVIILRI